jgi:hypothetical protein
MSLVFDIGQGAGLAGASGVRPFLPPLLTGALASGDVLVDFDDSTFDWVESPGFLLVILALAVLAYVFDRQAAPDPVEGGRSQMQAVMAAIAMVIGAILFGASLAEGGNTEYPGVIAGMGCALLGFFAIAMLLQRARSRLDAGAGALLNVYGDGLSLLIAFLTLVFPPVGFVAIIGFIVLLFRARGGGDKKYEGLRVLR